MNNKTQVILSLFSGITLGVIIAIIYSPEKGTDNYKSMVDFTKEFANDFITQGKKGLEATAKRWPN